MTRSGETDLGPGMTRRQDREDCRGTRIRHALARSSLGLVLVAATERGICAIDVADDPGALEQRLRERFPEAEFVAGDPEFETWVGAVVSLIEAPGTNVDLPLDVRGTAFQRRVWSALSEVPPGTMVTYGEVASRIGIAGGARAVAGACAANPLAVAIPCHRVVRSDGSLGGYRWGVDRKRRLLAREAVRSEP